MHREIVCTFKLHIELTANFPSAPLSFLAYFIISPNQKPGLPRQGRSFLSGPRISNLFANIVLA